MSTIKRSKTREKKMKQKNKKKKSGAREFEMWEEWNYHQVINLSNKCIGLIVVQQGWLSDVD